MEIKNAIQQFKRIEDQVREATLIVFVFTSLLFFSLLMPELFDSVDALDSTGFRITKSILGILMTMLIAWLGMKLARYGVVFYRRVIRHRTTGQT